MGVLRRFAGADSRTVSKFIPQQSSNSYNNYLESFTEFYLIPFYEYLDERLDDPQFTSFLT